MTYLLLPQPGITDTEDWIGLGLSQYPEPSWVAGLQFTENESEDSTVMVYLSSQSEVDNSKTTSIQLDWSESLNNSTTLIMSINRSDEQQDNWSLGIGLEWNG